MKTTDAITPNPLPNITTAYTHRLLLGLVASLSLLLSGCGGTSERPNTSPPNSSSPNSSSQSSQHSSSTSSQNVTLTIMAATGGRLHLDNGLICEGTCTTTVKQNQAVTITAHPETGYEFSGWQQGCEGTQTPCMLTPSGNTTIAANFQPLPTTPQKISVLTNIDGQGWVRINEQSCDDLCSLRVAADGQAIEITAAAKDNTQFSHWLGACAKQANPCSVARNDDFSVTAVFTDLPSPPTEPEPPIGNPNATLKVESFTLINATTNQPIAAFDPIKTGAVINIDQLPTTQLNLRANSTAATGSVAFTLNGQVLRTESRLPYALGSDDGYGDYKAWGLSLGTHEVQATPYEGAGASGAQGTPSNVSFKLVAVRLNTNVTTLNFDAVIGQGQAVERSFTINNQGNDNGQFSLGNLPAWLSASVSNGTISAGQSQAVTLAADACTTTLERSHTLQLSNNGDEFSRIAIEQYCLPDTGSSYDLSFERAYFMQSTTQQDTQQSTSERTPLIANREALLRVFVEANRDERQPLPQVNLHYELANGGNGVLPLEAPAAVPTAINEGQLSNTFNVTVPASILQPGTQVYIAVDDGNAVNELNERNNRYPASGYWALDIKQMPSFDITFVPIAINGELPSLTQQKARELLDQSLALHPIEQYSIEIRAPYTYTGNSWSDMVSEINSLRRSDGSSRFYHGIVSQSPDTSRTSGIGFISGKAAVSKPYQGTIAHELGHNFGRPHAPCGGVASSDSNYPYSNGRIGAYGYDSRSAKLKTPDNADYMSYCAPSWTSDYNYKKVVSALYNNTIYFKARPHTSDQVWHIEGSLIDEKIAVTQTWKTGGTQLPMQAGDYWVELRDAHNAVLGRSTFNMKHLDHSSDQFFYVSVANDIPNISVAKIVMGLSDDLLLQKEVFVNSTAATQQKGSNAPQAIRLDDQKVHLWWQQGLGKIKVYDSNQKLIAQVDDDATHDVILFTQSATLHLEYQHNFSLQRLTVQVD